MTGGAVVPVIAPPVVAGALPNQRRFQALPDPEYLNPESLPRLW
jgi:hypothetical protein